MHAFFSDAQLEGRWFVFPISIDERVLRSCARLALITNGNTGHKKVIVFSWCKVNLSTSGMSRISYITYPICSHVPFQVSIQAEKHKIQYWSGYAFTRT